MKGLRAEGGGQRPAPPTTPDGRSAPGRGRAPRPDASQGRARILVGAGIGLLALLLVLLAWPRAQDGAPGAPARPDAALARASVGGASAKPPGAASSAPTPAVASRPPGPAAPDSTRASAPGARLPDASAAASASATVGSRPAPPEPRDAPAPAGDEPSTGFLGGGSRGLEPATASPTKLAPLDQLFEETVRLLRPKGKSLSDLEEVTVERVVDGDTLWTKDKQKIRLIGINTPEKGFPIAKDATSLLAALTAGKKVRLENDKDPRDQFKRRLAYVYVGERCVNGEMVRKGVAHYYRWEPNVAHAEEILALQKLARADGFGIWSLPQPAPLRQGERYLCGAKEHVFHHPSCPRVQKTLEREGAAGMVYFDSRDDAFDSGRKADADCDR